MDETRLVILVRIVDSVTPEAEELLAGTVGTTCQKNAGNRQSHLLAETKCVGGFHVGNGDGKAQRGWKVLRAEVGVEVEGNLADHADDVAAVGGDHVDAVAMGVVENEVTRDFKDLRDVAVLRSRRRGGKTSMQRLWPLEVTLLIISRSWMYPILFRG